MTGFAGVQLHRRLGAVDVAIRAKAFQTDVVAPGMIRGLYGHRSRKRGRESFSDDGSRIRLVIL
jgi:hypothetical protein